MKRLFLLFAFFIATSSFAQYEFQLYSYTLNPWLTNDSYEHILVGKDMYNWDDYWGGQSYSIHRDSFKLKTTQIKNLKDTVDTYGYVKLESDPSVYGWAKQPSKPTYSTSEIMGYVNYTAGTGIDISSGVISTTAKRQETYSGTTNASGQYTVVFSNSYSVAPNIQANIVGGTDTQNIRITSVGTTGFTVTVRNRTDVVGLLPTWSNVNGASVDVLITQK